jgi:hypothetical protein
MRKTAVQIALVLILVLGGYIALFQREWALGMFRKAKYRAKGYSPAATPAEALDKFCEFIKKRDYDTAALYCSGEYAGLLKKGAGAGEKLGSTIDDVLSAIDNKIGKNEKCTLVLRLLDPFPPDIKAGDTKADPKDPDRATGVIIEETSGSRHARNPVDFHDWKVDPLLIHALKRDLVAKVELRREGDGEEKSWKIVFPVSQNLRDAVNVLNDKYKSYVTGLKTLHDEVNRDPDTKSKIESQLIAKLNESS